MDAKKMHTLSAFVERVLPSPSTGLPLYKFIERRHLDGFFASGALRLGTIHGYRDTVEYGEHRGDEAEGMHDVARQVDDYTAPDSGAANEPIISEIFNLGRGSRIIGMTLVSSRSSPDGFVFCMSHTYSEALFRRWHAAERLDACYEIVDIGAFCAAISGKIASSASFVGCVGVVYRDKQIDYRSSAANLSPAITKFRDTYGWQCEARAIWQPLMPSPPLLPWIIEVKDARRYARPRAYIEGSKIVNA